MEYYFVRVNGQTVHNNPKNVNCYVAPEPEEFIRNGYSNYLDYCFENNIVRMGWPDVGDLKKGNRFGAKAHCYDINNIKPHVRDYLIAFSNIQTDSVLLVPDRDNSGNIYICQVIKPYWYDIVGPYECSHRVGVKWDRDQRGQPTLYTTEQLGISKGGWWLRAFHQINDQYLISRISAIRKFE